MQGRGPRATACLAAASCASNDGGEGKPTAVVGGAAPVATEGDAVPFEPPKPASGTPEHRTIVAAKP